MVRARKGLIKLALGTALLISGILPSSIALSKDRLLEEAVEFTGAILFLEAKVPGLIIGAVRQGSTSVAGFGKVSVQQDQPPDGQTVLRIGSITKVFTGAVLASLVADGNVKLSDPLQRHLNWGVSIPTLGGKQIRLIDLVTHTSGLPREIERAPSPREDPFRSITKEAFIRNLQDQPLLFAPGTGALYSNFGFDLLAQALASVAGTSYQDLLTERVLRPAGLNATSFNPTPEQRKRLMQGHDPVGRALSEVPTGSLIVGSGGLYSTADDILRWMNWHLDRFSTAEAEMRLISHAAYVHRDALSPVFGMDESGRMDAIGLGWIVMNPRSGRPVILQKAGGLEGIFSYMAFAPARGVGVFAAINQFNVPAALKMAETVNELIGNLAPR